MIYKVAFRHLLPITHSAVGRQRLHLSHPASPKLCYDHLCNHLSCWQTSWAGKRRFKKPTLEKIGMLSDGGVTPPSPFLLIKNPAQKQCVWLKITLSGGGNLVLELNFTESLKKKKSFLFWLARRGIPPQRTDNWSLSHDISYDINHENGLLGDQPTHTSVSLGIWFWLCQQFPWNL